MGLNLKRVIILLGIIVSVLNVCYYLREWHNEMTEQECNSEES